MGKLKLGDFSRALTIRRIEENWSEENMESQGIRGTTLTVAGSNNENEVGMGPAAAKGRVLRAKRTAMTDIGNKANILQNAKNQIVKKEAIKSAELKKDNEDEVPMDLDVSKAMEDIEMAELAAPAVQAYSAKYLENVDDIDKDDVENPQLVVEYVNEI